MHSGGARQPRSGDLEINVGVANVDFLAPSKASRHQSFANNKQHSQLPAGLNPLHIFIGRGEPLCLIADGEG